MNKLDRDKEIENIMTQDMSINKKAKKIKELITKEDNMSTRTVTVVTSPETDSTTIIVFDGTKDQARERMIQDEMKSEVISDKWFECNEFVGEMYVFTTVEVFPI